MAEKTGIEWTDSTWPIVQGCDYESPGCKHCYVPGTLWRLMHNPNPAIAAPLQGLIRKSGNTLVFTGKVAMREDRLSWPLAWKKPRRIFVPSHGDIFHEAVTDDFLDKIFAVMALCPQHTFQVLTKRAERMRAYMHTPLRKRAIAISVAEISDMLAREARSYKARISLAQFDVAFPAGDRGPFANVWLGVSVEDQVRADERIPLLLQTPAAKRFLSCEPLLGPLDLTCLRWSRDLDWVIVGGESGKDARPMHPDWARSLRDQCQAAGVPFFSKQWGEYLPVDQTLPDHGKIHGATGVVPGRMKLHYGGSPTKPPKHAFAERGVEFGSFKDGLLTFRVGKKAAGRLLDGREWSEFPQSVPA